MQEVRYLKTRDHQIINDTLRMLKSDKGLVDPIKDTNLLLKLAEQVNETIYLFFDNDINQWVCTNILDDDLVIQEFFNELNFVIVETDPNIALGRAIHYRYHKKVRP